MKRHKAIDLPQSIGGGWVTAASADDFRLSMYDLVRFLSDNGEVLVDVPKSEVEMNVDYILYCDELTPMGLTMLTALPMHKYAASFDRGSKREARLKKFIKAYEALKAEETAAGKA
jgi:hypothetical protein